MPRKPTSIAEEIEEQDEEIEGEEIAQPEPETPLSSPGKGKEVLWLLPTNGEPTLVRVTDADSGKMTGKFVACACRVREDYQAVVKEYWQRNNFNVPETALYQFRSKVNVEVPSECLDYGRREAAQLRTGPKGRRTYTDNWTGREECRKALVAAVKKASGGAPFRILTAVELIREV